MANGGEQSDKDQSREDYQRRLANDIQKSQVGTSSGNDLKTEANSDSPDFDFEQDDAPEQEEDQDQPDTPVQTTDNLKKTSEAASVDQQIAEKQKNVPEYTVQSPAAKKKLPGGPAVKAGVKTAQNGESKVAGGVQKALSAEAEGVGKVGAQVAKKVAANAGQAVAKLAVNIGIKVAAATAEYWLPILLAIMALVIVIFGVIFLIKSLQTPNVNGSSPVQAADILNDRPWISKVLALSGNKEIAASLTADVLSGLQENLVVLKDDLVKPPLSNYDDMTKQKISAKIDEVNQLVVDFQKLQPTDPTREDAGMKIVNAVGQLVDTLSSAPFHYSGPTTYPIDPAKITGFNNSPHCNTFAHPAPCKSHRTFQAFRKNIADAADIGSTSGTEVRASFAGKVIRKSVVSKSYAGGYYIYIENTDSQGKKCVATYAHLNNDAVSEGTTVELGEKIGTLFPLGVSAPHVHFELSCNGQFIVMTKEELANWNSPNRKYSEAGEYVYYSLMNALNLDPTKRK